MSRVVHNDLICKIPITEHIGNEDCIMVVDEHAGGEVEDFKVAHYKSGPQGNMVADFYADHLARSGPIDRSRPLGTPGLADRRDNSDPAEVGKAWLDRTEKTGWLADERNRNGSAPHDQA